MCLGVCNGFSFLWLFFYVSVTRYTQVCGLQPKSLLETFKYVVLLLPSCTSFFLWALKVLLHVLNVQCCTGEVHGHPDSGFLIWYFSTFFSGKTEDLLVAHSVLQFFNHGILCRLIFILGLVLADYFNLDIDVLSPVRYILKYFRFSLFVSFILFRS